MNTERLPMSPCDHDCCPPDRCIKVEVAQVKIERDRLAADLFEQRELKLKAQADLAATRKQLCESEASRERLRKATCVCGGLPLDEGGKYCLPCEYNCEPPSTTLSDALRPVREALESIRDMAEVHWHYLKHESSFYGAEGDFVALTSNASIKAIAALDAITKP